MPGMQGSTRLRKLAVASPMFAAAGSESSSAFRGRRILIIEDDYFVALELEDRLTSAGFDVVGVSATAEDALVLAANQKPEIAIVDIRLAGPTDGIHAAERLLKDYKIRSIFATAHSDELTKKRGAVAQPLAWLEKPYRPEALISLVMNVLREKDS
jgi:DNA-binding response OmpR family regulator